MLLENFGNLFKFLADYPENHSRDTSFYKFLEGLTIPAFHDAQKVFEEEKKVPLAELGEINLPYEKMGAIDSIDLFGLDELIMFAFYYRNRDSYKKVADIGANIGLHSIVLSKCGFEVEAYEPDPSHASRLRDNLKLNDLDGCEVFEAAVSDKNGEMEFVRVLGNTTSSHLAGAKQNPYGELERFSVSVKEVKEIAERVDLFKIDAEGHEDVIIKGISIDLWNDVDAFVEIGTPENAQVVYDYFVDTNINIFSQKCGWNKITSLEGLPVSYKEGGIFISSQDVMPW